MTHGIKSVNITCLDGICPFQSRIVDLLKVDADDLGLFRILKVQIVSIDSTTFFRNPALIRRMNHEIDCLADLYLCLIHRN